MNSMRLYCRRDTGYWYIEFKRANAKSLRTKDSEVAKRVYRRVRKDVLLGRVVALDAETKVFLTEFREEYLASRRNKKAKNTVDKDDLALRKLIDIVGDKKIAVLSEKDFDRFVNSCLAARNRKRSVNVYLRHLRVAMNKAMRLGYVLKNPLVGYDFPEEEMPPTRFLVPKEIEKLISLMEEDGEIELRNFVLFSIFSGMRRNEIVELEAKDVRKELGIIHVRRSKTKKERFLPISPELREVLNSIDLPQVGRIFMRYRHPDTYTHKVKEYLVKAGFKEFRLHDLRHTFASLMSMSGASQKELMELLGHSDARTTFRYTHLAMDHLKEVVSKHRIAVDLHTVRKLRPVNGGNNKE